MLAAHGPARASRREGRPLAAREREGALRGSRLRGGGLAPRRGRLGAPRAKAVAADRVQVHAQGGSARRPALRVEARGDRVLRAVDDRLHRAARAGSRAALQPARQRAARGAALALGGREGRPPALAERRPPQERALALAGLRHADRAAHTGAAEPAVAVRILREVLLVVALRVVELAEGSDLRRDLAVALLVQSRLKHLA